MLPGVIQVIRNPLDQSPAMSAKLLSGHVPAVGINPVVRIGSFFTHYGSLVRSRCHPIAFLPIIRPTFGRIYQRLDRIWIYISIRIDAIDKTRWPKSATPQSVSGRAVEYFTCFMEILDFTFPTPVILAKRFTQKSRKSSRSRATTRST